MMQLPWLCQLMWTTGKLHLPSTSGQASHPPTWTQDQEASSEMPLSAMYHPPKRSHRLEEYGGWQNAMHLHLNCIKLYALKHFFCAGFVC